MKIKNIAKKIILTIEDGKIFCEIELKNKKAKIEKMFYILPDIINEIQNTHCDCYDKNGKLLYRNR